MFENEQDLVATLDKHDALIARFAKGELSIEAFLASYGGFPFRYALDGNESDDEERQLLARYANRIRLHFLFNEQILSQLCPEENASDEQYIKAGRFGPRTAVLKAKEFARQHL